jgi:hypothetical protein
MPRTYLDKLIDDAQAGQDGRQLPFPTVGAWCGDSPAGDFLPKFVHDIDVGGALDDLRLAHSVPSVYARPIIFAQAFRQPKSPLHKAVIREWRGLMAIFGLQSWIGYQLSFENYPVTAPPEGQVSAVGKVPQDDLHLRTMLHGLLPEPAEFWNPLRLIYANGTLVAAASPWTMVFTPASRIPAKTVPWADGKILVDPLEYYAAGTTGHSLELTILAKWIDHLISAQLDPANLNWGMGRVGGEFLGDISRQLAAWREELQRFVDDRWVVPLLNAPDEGAGPYTAALRTAQSPQVRETNGPVPEQSDLFLRSSKAAAGNVVALKRKGLPPRLRVHNGAFVEDIDLEDLPGSTGDLLKTRGGVEHHVKWVMAEEVFFPPKIARVSPSAEALSCSAGKDLEYSLPLATEFLKSFSHADAASMLKVAASGTDTDTVLTATLNLPLQGKARPLTIQKVYKISESLADLGELTTPAFGLWPNFVAEDWTHNFAMYAGPHELGHAAFTVKPLHLDGTCDVSTQVDGTEKDLRVWRSVKPFIGFALVSAGEEAGLILRQTLRLPADPVSDKKWVVAVDFGTCNTMIRYQVQGGHESGKEAPLELKSRLVILNHLSGLYERKIKKALYPQEGRKPPIRTLLHTLEAATHGFETSPYTLGFDFLTTDVGTLVRDVKWGRDMAAMREYLRSVVRYVICEARDAGAKELNLVWSYPLALPDGSRQEMATFWGAVAGDYTSPKLAVQVGHMAVSKIDGSEKTRFEASLSESEATCRSVAWFPKSPVPVGSGGLCIAVDVGGGSTDFAYWSKGNLLDQFSFKLAGNDVLCGELRDLPTFFERILWVATGKEFATEQWEEYVKQNLTGNAVEVFINQVLSTAFNNAGVLYTDPNPLNHPAVIRIFSTGCTQSPWIEIRTLALLLFGGVSYYAGLHARDFISKTELKNEVILCFAGKGSSLLAWLSNDPRHLEDVLAGFFQGGFAFENNAVPADLSVRVAGACFGEATKYPPLKEEVATGSLQPAIGTVGPALNPYVGEIGWRQPGSANPIPWNTRLSATEMANLVPPQDAGKLYIADFLHNWAAENPKVAALSIDLERLKSLSIHKSDIQHRLVMDIKGTATSQPLFAIELKSLMEKYVSYVLQSASNATAA